MKRVTNGFGKELRDYREKNFLTQQSLADKLDVPLRTIKAWEYNTRTPHKLKQIGIMKVLKTGLEK